LADIAYYSLHGWQSTPQHAHYWTTGAREKGQVCLSQPEAKHGLRQLVTHLKRQYPSAAQAGRSA